VKIGGMRFGGGEGGLDVVMGNMTGGGNLKISFPMCVGPLAWAI
jgi:hypothetical protein